MRQITASAVKPGMTIEWSELGIKYTCVVSSIEPARSQISQEIMASGGGEATLYNNTMVTVLAEPTPPQPEEPTAFGACVRVDGVEYIRDGVDDLWFTPKLIDCSRNHRWEDITARGQVEVVNPNPFARVEEAPEQTPDAPEVPERIEEC